MRAAMAARGEALEVVFVSGDKTAESFAGYHATMPWPALPFTHPHFRAAKEWLDETFEVDGVPTLTLFDASGAMTRSDASAKVRADPEGLQYPWPLQPVNSLEDTMPHINSGVVCLAMVGEEAVDKGEAARSAMAAAAAGYFAQQAPEARFSVQVGGCGSLNAVRRFCNVKPVEGEAAGTRWVVIDVPRAVKAYLPAELGGGGGGMGAPSSEQVAEWVSAFVAGKAAKVGIKE